MKKWLKRAGYSILVLFILLNVMAVFHAWQFTHFYPDAPVVDLKNLTVGQKVSMLFFGYKFPKSKITRSPEENFETVNLTVNDGLNISGWLIEVDSSNKAVILLHGHGSQKGSLLDQAKYFRKLGYSTLLIDFRAHGESDGTTCTIGYNEIDEVAAAFDFMKGKEYDNIILFGSSMGAAAITRAVREKQLKATQLILEMPFGSLPDAVKGRMRIMGLPASPLSELLTFWGGTEHGYWAFSYSPCEYSKDLLMPVLLQWGDQDPRVQAHEIQCIYQNIPNQKQLVVYSGAGHQSLYKFDSLKWESSIRTFLNP